MNINPFAGIGMFKTLPLVREMLDTPSGIMIGSRGLEISTGSGDYDICIHKDDLPTAVKKDLIPLEIKRYFKIVPLNNSELYRVNKNNDSQPSLYILVYDKIEDIHIIKKTMDEMRQIPRYILAIKTIRIVLFEELLIKNGFIRVE